jgi:hypothetical protein
VPLVPHGTARLSRSLAPRGEASGLGESGFPPLLAALALCRLVRARDQTGCSIPKLNSGDGWLLRGEIRFDDLPADVVVNTNTWGYCLLNRDDIKGDPY